MPGQWIKSENEAPEPLNKVEQCRQSCRVEASAAGGHPSDQARQRMRDLDRIECKRESVPTLDLL